MNAKSLSMLTEITVEDLTNIINATNEEQKNYNIQKEKEEIKMLTIYKKESNIFTYFNLIIKRIIDIIGSLFGIITLIPLSIIIAIINFANKDFGPLFYSHKRIGKNGKYFKMYKFRTMVVDADKKLTELLQNDELARKEWNENRKLRNDPRITKIGHFLRKTSLDEWPQFLCVFLGKMSLVGPRAVVEDEIEKFGIYQKDILSVKPGITGYWAANGRSDTTYEERVFMEHKYVREFSVYLDIKILLKTLISVIKKEGAV